MNWELNAAPYLPILRRRVWRRRIGVALLIAAVLAPVLWYRHVLAKESIGTRVFDDVNAAVADSYYDPGFHGLSWVATAAHYRDEVENAPDPAARYDALRRMLAALGDSHTAAFSPLEL
ncbi:MAG TPA: hypothetical protein VEJ20_01715, partial [Candidatus Eremiobacteraceae bacterium]|nr:hypothetical protein [Candidatus Eremiobacteraceae bacterium]